MSSAADHRYQRTHPWINFTFDLTALTPLDWMRMGEAISKGDHIAGVPLKPKTADELDQLYLIKGVHATTQIEGNTLTEEEIRKTIEGTLELPRSQEYLKTEARNIVNACNLIFSDVAAGTDLTMTPQRIKDLNRHVMADLPRDEDESGTGPGEVREHSVVVGGLYRGAPFEDCDYLLARLCDWLRSFTVDAPEYLHRPLLVIRAILAHLYLAWIHPFDDGNGRTARLIETQLLLAAGFPGPAALLLSNHYNRTRARYYAVLRMASEKEPYRPEQFVAYALEGLVDGLREQLETILGQQLEVAWVNYVHEVCRSQVRDSAARARQRTIALTLPFDRPTPINAIRRHTAWLAEQYAGLQDRAITRDVNALIKLGLLEGSKKSGVRPAIDLLGAFMPLLHID